MPFWCHTWEGNYCTFACLVSLAGETISCSVWCLFCVNLATVICTVHVETIRRYDNSPSIHDWQNGGCYYSVYSGQKENRFPFFNFLDSHIPGWHPFVVLFHYLPYSWVKHNIYQICSPREPGQRSRSPSANQGLHQELLVAIVQLKIKQKP